MLAIPFFVYSMEWFHAGSIQFFTVTSMAGPNFLDTATTKDERGFSFEGLPDLMDKCHEESVTFFFSLLKQDFLETLKPEYSE